MDASKENIHEAALIIASELEMDEKDASQIMEQDKYEAVKQLLAERIKYLLDFDPEKMKYILYRIDINEQKVLETLSAYPLHEAVLHIAEMILQREIQKAITRKQYHSSPIDPDLAL